MLHLQYLPMDEIEHLNQILDYLPCNTCEKETSEEERKYFCTVCKRLNRTVSAERTIPKWKMEGNKVIAVDGMEIKELKPKVKTVENKKEPELLIEEVEILEIGEKISEDEVQIEEELPEWDSIEEGYRKGEYMLYTKEVTFRGNRKQRIYFFSKKTQKNGTPCPLPKGYKVKVNKKTGLPFLKKK